MWPSAATRADDNSHIVSISVALQAFEKNPKDGDTLANLVAVSLHLGKPASRYQSQLKLVAPAHALVRRSEEGEAAFDRAAASAVTA